jgi:hypothetical protein
MLVDLLAYPQGIIRCMTRSWGTQGVMRPQVNEWYARCGYVTEVL